MTTRLPSFVALALVAIASVVPVRGAQARTVHPRAVDVRAVRLWAGPDNTRVVLDLSGSAQHSLAMMKNPDRIVLDVAGAQLTGGARAAPAAAGVVKQVRMARRPSGELRIVFDLSHPIRAKSFLAQPN
jgi:N-acetylmuramoyl-L-alanine amidase